MITTLHATSEFMLFRDFLGRYAIHRLSDNFGTVLEDDAARQFEKDLGFGPYKPFPSMSNGAFNVIMRSYESQFEPGLIYPAVDVEALRDQVRLLRTIESVGTGSQVVFEPCDIERATGLAAWLEKVIQAHDASAEFFCRYEDEKAERMFGECPAMSESEADGNLISDEEKVKAEETSIIDSADLITRIVKQEEAAICDRLIRHGITVDGIKIDIKTRGKPSAVWTDDDQNAALAEGWGIFDNDEYGVRIEHYADAGVFDTDWKAISFVCTRIRQGDPLAHKAAAFLLAYYDGVGDSKLSAEERESRFRLFRAVSDHKRRTRKAA